MKKLSKNEVNVLSNVIVKKVNEKKFEKIESKLESDKEYKMLKKLNEEIKVLDKKRNEMNKKYSEISLKVRNKFNISNVYKDMNGDIKVSFSNNDFKLSSDIVNDLVIMSIGREIDIESLINSLIEKYSK
jgi:hypothetical protein